MTAFMITKDLVEMSSEENAEGVKGPSNISDTDAIMLELGHGIPFRLLDDDRNVYYYGRRLEESDADDDYDAEPELAPLDCFGAPNAGCTIQEEKNAEGKWEAIN